jgi:hypothetical protein
MQRTGEAPITITLEDAVVIMTNQQKTIEELIVNNQRMFQYIQEAQKMGGFGNIQFAQQNLSDPASHIYRGGVNSSNASQTTGTNKPMTLNEYLAMKKNSSSSISNAPSSSTTTAPSAPMTLSEFLALKKSNTSSVETSSSTNTQVEEVPVFDTPSKTDPIPF